MKYRYAIIRKYKSGKLKFLFSNEMKIRFCLLPCLFRCHYPQFTRYYIGKDDTQGQKQTKMYFKKIIVPVEYFEGGAAVLFLGDELIHTIRA